MTGEGLVCCARAQAPALSFVVRGVGKDGGGKSWLLPLDWLRTESRRVTRNFLTWAGWGKHRRRRCVRFCSLASPVCFQFSHGRGMDAPFSSKPRPPGLDKTGREEILFVNTHPSNYRRQHAWIGPLCFPKLSYLLLATFDGGIPQRHKFSAKGLVGRSSHLSDSPHSRLFISKLWSDINHLRLGRKWRNPC